MFWSTHSKLTRRNTRMMFGDYEFWTKAGECFLLSSVASAFTQLREKTIPPIRVVVATCLWVGASAVMFVSIWVNYYGLEHSAFLYFASLLSGLGSANLLTMLYSKAIPRIVNFFYKRATGEDLIDLEKEGKE